MIWGHLPFSTESQHPERSPNHEGAKAPWHHRIACVYGIQGALLSCPGSLVRSAPNPPSEATLTDLSSEGGELFHQIVKLTYFSEDLARHVILQVAHAIRYLHEEKGVVHRFVTSPGFISLELSR